MHRHWSAGDDRRTADGRTKCEEMIAPDGKSAITLVALAETVPSAPAW